MSDYFPSVRTVAIKMLERDAYPIDHVSDFLYCFPCLENLHILFVDDLFTYCYPQWRTEGGPSRYDPNGSITCLNQTLKCVSLWNYPDRTDDMCLNDAPLQISNYFVENAICLEILSFSRQTKLNIQVMEQQCCDNYPQRRISPFKVQLALLNKGDLKKMNYVDPFCLAGSVYHEVLILPQIATIEDDYGDGSEVSVHGPKLVTDIRTEQNLVKLHKQGTRSSGRIPGDLSKRKQIGVDAVTFQAAIPEWVAPSEEEKAEYRNADETLRKMGTVVRVPPIVEPRQTRTSLKEKNVVDDKCKCSHPGYEACVGAHVKEAWKRVKCQLGKAAFRNCGFDAMGERVLKLWTVEDKKKLAAIERSVPQNNHEEFMKIALKQFKSERTRNLSKYYYNIFLPRRLARLNRTEGTDAKNTSPGDDGNPVYPSEGKSQGTRSLRTAGDLSNLPIFLMSMRKEIGVDAVTFQAAIPEWVAPSEEEKAEYRNADETLRKMGTVVRVPPIVEPRQTRTSLKEKNVVDDKCQCSHPGSEACVGAHVKEAWKRVKCQLGKAAFRNCGFDAMGERVLKLWTVEDKKKLAAIERLVPQNNHEDFMKIALKQFKSERTRDLSKYYFNIFLPRRLARLNRTEGTYAKNTSPSASLWKEE